MIWDNDKEYSKEFQEYARKEAENFAKQVEDNREKIKRQQAQMSRIKQPYDKGQYINNYFAKQYLESKILAAKWMLGLGMAITLLFKWQWILWIIFIIAYNIYVKTLRKQMLERDMKERQDNERMD